jgi:hypothetical protein
MMEENKVPMALSSPLQGSGDPARGGPAINDNGGSSFTEHEAYRSKYVRAINQTLEQLRAQEQQLRLQISHLSTNFAQNMQERREELRKQFEVKRKEMEERHQRERKELQETLEKKQQNMQQQIRSQGLMGLSTLGARIGELQREAIAAHTALVQKHTQEAMQLQQSAFAQGTNEFMTTFRTEQENLKAEIQQRILHVQSEIQKYVERQKAGLFEVDSRFAHVTLSQAQKQFFIQNGFLKVEGVIPRELLDEAIQIIDYTLAKEKREGVEPEFTLFRRPELETCDQITGLLYRTAAIALVQALIGRSPPPRPCFGGQIALRPPGFSALPGVLSAIRASAKYMAPPAWERAWHIDGLHNPHSGVPAGQVHNFTLLLGILLTDLPEPLMGNLTVYPGGHLAMESHFRKEGLQAIIQRGQLGLPRSLPIGNPLQITGKAGDIVLVHYQMPHTVAPNLSSNMRYAVYFRFHAQAHTPQTFRPETFTDIWLDYPPLHSLVRK